MKKIGRSSVSVALAVVGLLALAGPALAEGSWSSFIRDASIGFSSRTWTDRNTDSAHTTITFTGCNASFVEVQLTRERGFPLPDVNMGRKQLCSATGDWGDVEAGNYHFTITGGPSSNIDVQNVTVQY